MLVYLIPTSHVPLQVEILHRLKRSLLAARSHFAMTKSSNTERERGLLQNPAIQREDFFKIQQYRERERTSSKSSKTQKGRVADNSLHNAWKRDVSVLVVRECVRTECVGGGVLRV